MIVDKNSAIPAYRQLKTYLLNGIEQEKWTDEIPSERRLVMLAGVTRMTVRQAIGELVSEGKLYRIKGKGTFIAKPKFEQHNIMSFSALMEERGIIPKTSVLLFDPAFTDIASVTPLWAECKDPFYRLRRLRCAGRDPVGIEEVYLPHTLCPHLETHDLTGSLYAILRAYGHTVAEQDVSIMATLPTASDAAILGIHKDTPLLQVRGNSLSPEQVPLFYECDSYLSDRFSYKVSIRDRY